MISVLIVSKRCWTLVRTWYNAEFCACVCKYSDCCFRCWSRVFWQGQICYASSLSGSTILCYFCYFFFAAWYFPLIFQTGRKPPGNRDNHLLPALASIARPEASEVLGHQSGLNFQDRTISYCNALYQHRKRQRQNRQITTNRPDVALLLLLDHLWTESQQTTLPMWAANTILYFNLLTWESLTGWYSYKQPTKNKDYKGLKESTRACSISNTTRRANDPLKPNVNACYDGCIVLHAAACCM